MLKIPELEEALASEVVTRGGHAPYLPILGFGVSDLRKEILE